ncbi:MAG: putative metalloprotease CJM1_0395 family protein [Desulfobulbaceae bacterium]|nr:putative metalloprotease CJM1_0395 family protein [Desulfobulbaceae bacterium]
MFTIPVGYRYAWQSAQHPTIQSLNSGDFEHRKYKTTTNHNPTSFDKVTISEKGSRLALNQDKDLKSSKMTHNNTDQHTLQKLHQKDRKVKLHENAHLSNSGGYARATTFSYTKGPDGHQYVTGGEVAIDVAAATTPQQTITKMKTVRRAALAPNDPSPADFKVAAKAAMREISARRELQTTKSNIPDEEKIPSSQQYSHHTQKTKYSPNNSNIR